MVVKIFLFLMLSTSLITASDSLRTVSEFGRRVFQNLNITDTLNGSARYDSTSAQKHVRDAVIEIGTMIPTEMAKSIFTTDGTFGYLIDAHLIKFKAVIVRDEGFGQQLDVVPFEKFGEAYSQMSTVYDSTYEFCGIQGDSLYPYPPPRRTDTLYLFYYARGDVPSIYSDTVDMPHELYTAVEYLATMKGAADIVDDAKLKIYSNLYAIAISPFQGDKTPQ